MSLEKHLKKLLRDQLLREEELYDFCIECLKKLYPEHSDRAIMIFDNSIDCFEFNGCIQSLNCVDSTLKEDLKQIEEYRAKHKAKLTE